MKTVAICWCFVFSLSLSGPLSSLLSALDILHHSGVDFASHCLCICVGSQCMCGTRMQSFLQSIPYQRYRIMSANPPSERRGRVVGVYNQKNNGVWKEMNTRTQLHKEDKFARAFLSCSSREWHRKGSLNESSSVKVTLNERTSKGEDIHMMSPTQSQHPRQASKQTNPIRQSLAVKEPGQENTYITWGRYF
jgi:hypothetical protein